MSSSPNDLVARQLDIPDDPRLGVAADPAAFSDADWRTYAAPEWQATLGDL